jgi:hypothetical protein
VSLCQAGASNQCSGALTDATGQFELKGVFPGRYVLSATCNGYLEQRYGQRTPGESGAILNLSRGQKLSGLSLRLIQAAVIYGHVYDEDGIPAPDAVVSELHPVYINGQRQLRSGTVVRTNDLGEYRIWGLNPGQHFVLAEFVRTRLATVRSEIGYLPTFYPGVLDAAHAAPIMVSGGDEFAGANIDLQPARTVRIRGHIYGAGLHARVFLLLRDISAIGAFVPPVYAHQREGDYELYNVTPGQYFIYAASEDGRGPMIAREPLDVTDTNLDAVDLTLQPGINLSGIIRVEGNPRLDSASWRITLSPRNLRFALGHTPSAVSNHGSFSLQNLYPGDYDVQVDDLPATYFLRSARAGADVLDQGLSITLPHGPRFLDILISPNGATIDGVVSKDQQPYSGATVTLVPDPPHRLEQHLFKLAATDQFGRFLLQGVPPGDYKLFAWESVEHAAYTNSDFLRPFEVRGESARVSEGSHVTVNLELIPKTEAGQ